MIKKLTKLANDLGSRGLEEEAGKIRMLITASRSRRDDGMDMGFFRRPSGQRRRLDPETRNKARPPDSWDDKPRGRESWAPNRAVARMIDQGLDDDQILEKLTSEDGKWRISHRNASKMIQWEREKHRYLREAAEREEEEPTSTP